MGEAMNYTKVINDDKKNRSVRKYSKKRKISKKIKANKKNSKTNGLSKIVFLACLILISLKFVDIRVGNRLKSEENKPIENSKVIEKEPLMENNQTITDDELKLLNEQNNKYDEYTECDVKAPKKRSDSEIYSDLNDMSINNEEIKKIYNHKELYPIVLLGSLVNNPEMTQFVSGYLDLKDESYGNFEVDDLKEKNKLILQWDKRWGYESYGNSIIAVSGCAPTSLAMVISQLTDGPVVTPYDLAKFSEEKGYYVKGDGTSWGLMCDAANEYGISAQETSSNVASMKKKLDDGQLIICTMNPGDFTSEGHFIVVYGYDESGFLVNDPNCVFRSKKSWDFNSFSSQIRNAWAYKKK